MNHRHLPEQTTCQRKNTAPHRPGRIFTWRENSPHTLLSPSGWRNTENSLEQVVFEKNMKHSNHYMIDACLGNIQTCCREEFKYTLADVFLYIQPTGKSKAMW